MPDIDAEVYYVPEFTLGDRLRKAREGRHLDQRSFAAALGVSQRTIGNCESERHTPRPLLLRAWALTCQVPVEWLETGTVPSEMTAPFGVRLQGLEPRTR